MRHAFTIQSEVPASARKEQVVRKGQPRESPESAKACWSSCTSGTWCVPSLREGNSFDELFDWPRLLSGLWDVFGREI